MTNEEFNALLQAATLKVDEVYIQFPVANRDGGRNLIVRERVYCYELYHQLRSIWVDDALVLNGEVNKIGHPLQQRWGNLGGISPDLLVHSPGNADVNYLAMEIKGYPIAVGADVTDVEKLLKLRTLVGYERAIYLVFGVPDDQSEHLERSVRRAVENVVAKGCRRAQIELWVHRGGTRAIEVAKIG